MEVTVNMPAGQFKAKCLKVMDQVQRTHETVVITKFGKPVAKLVPIEEKSRKLPYGFLRDSVMVRKGIVASTGEKWDADA